jgi:hypothetical protein
MFRNDAPLLFRPQLDWQQWRWGLQFLAQCNDAAFERNVQQLVALGAYSHAALKDVVPPPASATTGWSAASRTYFTDQKAFDDAGEAAALMQKYGVDAPVVSRDELLAIEPAFRLRAPHRRRHLHRQRRERRRPRLHAEAGAALRRARRALPVTATTSSGWKRPAARSNPSPCAAATRYRHRAAPARPTTSWWPAAPTRRRCCAPWAWTCRSTRARATARPSS